MERPRDQTEKTETSPGKDKTEKDRSEKDQTEKILARDCLDQSKKRLDRSETSNIQL